MRRALVLIAVGCITVAACGSSSKPTASTTTIATTTTTAGDTTVPLTSVPVTTVPATTTTIATVIKESAYVVSVDVAAHTITIDPMEFLTGEAATTEYHKAAPNDPGGPPNDYFIVNPTKDQVLLPLQAQAPVQIEKLGATVQTVSIPQAQLATEPALGSRPFWITIERGSVAAVTEQFVP